jgi:hypothetical protein
VRHDVIKKAIYGGVTGMRIIKHKRYGIHPFFLFTLGSGMPARRIYLQHAL